MTRSLLLSLLLLLVGQAFGQSVMMPGPGMPALSGFTCTTYATWNPSDKSADITLSSGDLTASTTTSAGQRGVRSTIGKSTGKWYWEITVTSVTAGFAYLGVEAAGTALTSPLGNTATGWGYHGNDGNKRNNNVGSAYGATYASTNIIGVAINLDAAEIEYFKNGVSQGVAFNNLTGTVYAGLRLLLTGNNVTANFGATAFAYSVPSGYTAGLCD